MIMVDDDLTEFVLHCTIENSFDKIIAFFMQTALNATLDDY